MTFSEVLTDMLGPVLEMVGYGVGVVGGAVLAWHAVKAAVRVIRGMPGPYERSPLDKGMSGEEYRMRDRTGRW